MPFMERERFKRNAFSAAISEQIESSIPADLVPSILEAHSLEGVDYDSVVCDALWLVSSEVLHEDTKMRETLIATARELRKEHVIYDKTLRETCEVSTRFEYLLL